MRCSHALTNLYLSYDSYRALARNASNAEIIVRLITWLVLTIFLAVCDNLIDPVFSQVVPFYAFAKVAVVAWMVHPNTLGAYLLFIAKIDPWLASVQRDLAKHIPFLTTLPRASSFASSSSRGSQ